MKLKFLCLDSLVKKKKTQYQYNLLFGDQMFFFFFHKREYTDTWGV